MASLPDEYVGDVTCLLDKQSTVLTNYTAIY